MESSTKNLLFLLAVAPMGMGGCITIEPPNGEAGDGDGDGETNGDGDGDGDPTNGDGDGDSTSGDGDGDDDGDGHDDDEGDGDGDDPEAACSLYANTLQTCYGRTYSDGYAYCNELLDVYEMYYGLACREAFEALLVCLSTLSCEEFEDLESCPAELNAAEAACL